MRARQLLLFLLAAGRASAQVLPSFQSMERSTWTEIKPAETANTCFSGNPYTFWVRRGVSDTKLVIYLAGGGACWNEATCLDTYKDPVSCQGVGFTNIQYSPGLFNRGIVNYERDDNPFKDYSFVFIPYCSADVFLGSRESVQYGGTTYKHLGALNVNVTLNWVKQNVQPDTIAIVGYSAGGYGGVTWAPSVENMYPNAKVVLIWDAADGATNQGADLASSYAQWGAINDYYAPISKNLLQTLQGNPAELFRVFFDTLMNSTNITVAQINTLDDQNQVQFNRALAGRNTSTWRHTMVNDSEYLRTLPQYYVYLMPGSFHGSLTFDSMYDLTLNGVKLTDWVSSVMSGSGSSQVCSTCSLAKVSAQNGGSCAGSGNTTLCSSNDVAIVGGTCDCTAQGVRDGTTCGDRYEICGSKEACFEDELETRCNGIVQGQMLTLMADSEISPECTTLLVQVMSIDMEDMSAAEAQMGTYCENQCFIRIAESLISAGCDEGGPDSLYGTLSGAYERQCRMDLSLGRSMHGSPSEILALLCVGASLVWAGRS